MSKELKIHTSYTSTLTLYINIDESSPLSGLSTEEIEEKIRQGEIELDKDELTINGQTIEVDDYEQDDGDFKDTYVEFG